MPPTALRRPLTITTWIIVSLLVLATSPLLLGLAAVVSATLHRPQPLLLARMLVAYFARELGVLIACGALWLASGCVSLLALAGAATSAPAVVALVHFNLRAKPSGHKLQVKSNCYGWMRFAVGIGLADSLHVIGALSLQIVQRTKNNRMTRS